MGLHLPGLFNRFFTDGCWMPFSSPVRFASFKLSATARKRKIARNDGLQYRFEALPPRRQT